MVLEVKICVFLVFVEVWRNIAIFKEHRNNRIFFRCFSQMGCPVFLFSWLHFLNAHRDLWKINLAGQWKKRNDTNENGKN